MTLAPGTKFGPYEILSPLGAGGMGEVYRARDTRLERLVAIKILPAHLSTNPERKLRFEREAKTISGLNHPNICSLFDVGSQDGTDFLVMECIEGESLAERLGKGPLPTEQVLKIGTEIADALDRAHRSGVVHRDLKPGNIMITKTGSKLLDFGLAKPSVATTSGVTLTNAAASSPVTEQGTIVGTFQYMSPEQVEGRELDGRSDIFSLGAVLYEMLTGQRAFEGKSQLSVASAILEKEPAPITSIKPLTPRNLDHIVRRCLAKDPDDRWQSARDLALELKSISASDAASSVSGAAPVRSSRQRREMVAWSVAAVAVVGAVVAAGILLLRPHQASSAMPLYSSIVAPQGTAFEIEGDMGKQPALSPDGTEVVFGAGGELYLHSLRTGADRVLSGAHGATSPFWSPDGESIGFFADFKVKTLALNTGVVRVVCDAPSPRGGSWGRNGTILFTPTPRDAIFEVPATGGTAKAVTTIDTKAHSTHRWPWFLPDGEHFLYYAANHAASQGQQNGIYVASVDGKLDRFLVTSPAAGVYSNGKLLYAKESGLLAQRLELGSYSLSGAPQPLVDNIVVDLGVWHMTVAASCESDNLVYQTGAAMALSRLEWVDRTGAHLSYVGDKGVYFGPRLSKDGQRFLVTYGDPSPDVWVFDSSGKNKTRLTFDNTIVGEANWSPDNTRFTSILGLANSTFQIVTRSVSGSGQSVPEQDAGNAVTDWSPDGKYLLTERSTQTSYEVEAVPVGSKDAPRAVMPASGTPGPYSSGQFSPDGKYVAVTVLLTSGPEVFIVPFTGGSGMWQVTTDGGHWARWSRDGKQLYYVNTKNTLNSVEIQEKADGLEVGHPVALFTFRPSARVYRLGLINYDVSPDGQRFLLVTGADENSRPLSLLQHWTNALSTRP